MPLAGRQELSSETLGVQSDFCTCVLLPLKVTNGGGNPQNNKGGFWVEPWAKMSAVHGEDSQLYCSCWKRKAQGFTDVTFRRRPGRGLLASQAPVSSHPNLHMVQAGCWRKSLRTWDLGVQLLAPPPSLDRPLCPLSPQWYPSQGRSLGSEMLQPSGQWT